MRVARPVAVTVLGLLAAACGGGAPIAHASPSSTGSAPVTSGGTTTTTASRHTAAAGTPLGARATAPPASATTPPAPVATAPAATPAARTAAPTPAPGPCGIADVVLSTTADRPHYALGETVQVTVEVRNQSTHGCIFGAAGEFTIDADPAGPTVFLVHLDCPPDGCAPLAPGQMSTYPISWNQVTNEGPGAPRSADAGSYHARASFTGYPVSTSPSFTIG